MTLFAAFSSAALKLASDTAAIGIGGAVGWFIVLGGSRLLRWLNNRAA